LVQAGGGVCVSTACEAGGTGVLAVGVGVGRTGTEIGLDIVSEMFGVGLVWTFVQLTAKKMVNKQPMIQPGLIFSICFPVSLTVAAFSDYTLSAGV
jgi:hypothetical protein